MVSTFETVKEGVTLDGRAVAVVKSDDGYAVNLGASRTAGASTRGFERDDDDLSDYLETLGVNPAAMVDRRPKSERGKGRPDRPANANPTTPANPGADANGPKD